MNRLLALSSIVLLASGCSLMQPQTKPIEVITIKEPAPVYHPPLPLELQMVDIEWRVLTPDIMAEYLKLLESGSAPPQAYYALTTKHYEGLSMNMADQKRYLKQIISIVEYYRELDKKQENTEEDPNN